MRLVCRQHTHRTSPPTTNITPHKREETRTIRKGEGTVREESRATGKGSRTTRKCRPNPKTGESQHYHSRHSIGPQGKRQGGRQHTDGDTDIRWGVSNTAALPSLCHPPPAMAPPSTTVRGRVDRGYPTTRTPQTHTPPPTHHTPSNGQCATRTAILASTAMG